MRTNWHQAQASIEAALDRMRLPVSYWQHTMPAVVQDWLRRSAGQSVRSRRLQEFDALTARLDRETPGWERSASEFLLAPAIPASMAYWRPVAALLGGRALARPVELIRFVDRWADAFAGGGGFGWSDKYRGAQCVLALISTDTTDTLSLWRGALARLCAGARAWRRDPACGADGAIFLIFLKLLQHRLLSYDEFARAARSGEVFHPRHYSGRRVRPPFYQPVLDRLGLSASRYFRVMYQRLAHEQLDRARAGGWEDVWWLRRLSGHDYFFTALEELEADPVALPALHAAKWGFDFGERGPALVRRLGAFGPRTLATVSLLRDDLDQELAQALECEAHPRAMAWLRGSTAAAWVTAQERPPWLADWCERLAEVAAEAVEHMWLLGLPPMPSPHLLETLRVAPANGAAAEAEAERYALVERFLSAHLCPDFTRISLNLDYADALAGHNEDALLRRAREDTPTAIRALGLGGGDERERVEVLLSCKRRGDRSVRAAAQQALEMIARRHGCADARELERRQELAMAWSDGGLEGRPSRVWWDVGNYRIKLSPANGKVHVIAYGRRGPLRSIPRAVRDHPDFAEISAARRELTQQYVEFRARLEDAMITGRAYSPAELAMLRSNPVFADLIGRLLLVVGGDLRLGCGQCAQPARIAHPAELLAMGALETWQRTIVDERVVQPFKQCFREVYRPAADEMAATGTARFAGHRVLVPRAFALLRSKGYSPGRGQARRDWPHAAIQSHFAWGVGRPRLDYHLSEDGRDQPVVTGNIAFHRLGGDGKPCAPLTIGEVPPIVFSETMRDADLVVSLAAAGELGFTSEQTVQLRLALARQLARILGLTNVAGPDTGSYVVVQGELATYRVHLGSASIFIEPTGAHLPVPQSPGRQAPLPAYLPFEDVDSRTAEVLRVIVTLSRDAAIEDERFRDCLARLTEAAQQRG
jgi:hypothetical protein